MRQRITLLATAGLAAAVATPFGAAELPAQQPFPTVDTATAAPPVGHRRVDVTVAGGMFGSSDWSDLVILGVQDAGAFFERALIQDVAVSAGPLAEVAVTYWRGRYGVRAHGGFSRSCMSVGPGCPADAVPQAARDTLGITGDADRVDTWLYDVSAVVGLRAYRPGLAVWPYVFAGAGGVTYRPGDALHTVMPSFVAFGGRGGRLRPDDDGELVVDPIRGLGGGTTFLVAADQPGFETVLAGVAGIGATLRIPTGAGGLGVSFELADHVVDSPLDARLIALRRDFGLDFFGLDVDEETQEIELDFGLVHNIRLTVGGTLAVPLP